MKARTDIGLGLGAVVVAAMGCARSDPATQRGRSDFATPPVLQAPAVRVSHDTEGDATPAGGSGAWSVSPGDLWARWNALRGDVYELDSIDRFVDAPAGRVACDDQGMQIYTGTKLRYHVPVKVSVPFRERLARFENVVAEVAEEVYGRAPRRIRHLGAYSCRLSRNRAARLSEHALGNAIDIAGFDFRALDKRQAAESELPRTLKGAFQVSVARHWRRPGEGTVGVHARFLELLTERLLARRDIFRVAIGPSHRGHQDHFHFDVSPWRYADL